MGNNEIINRIDEFVKIDDNENYLYNNFFNSERLKWILNLLDELNIYYYVVEAESSNDETIRNIYVPGTNNKLIVAHHDIVDPNFDNANDNSCSILNSIALKTINPSVNLALTDGEEIGMIGAKKLSNDLSLINKKDKYFPDIDYIFVLELTGFGRNIVVSKYNKKNDIHNLLKKFKIHYYNNFIINEAEILNRRNFDCELITTAPMINEQINLKHYENIHSDKDSLNTINKNDMINFVDKFLYPLTK